MDGNGRWAREKGLTRTAGHLEGIKRVRETVNAAAELGIKALTFFVFSTENWDRPKSEVGMLMRYLNDFLDREVKKLHKNNIRFMVIGRDDPLPKQVLNKITRSEELTRNNTGLIVILALNYGSRQEIADAAKRIAEDALKGKIRASDIDEELFAKYLYTAGIPEPDLLIRTSGESRVSNFLLWQLSYTEFYFPKAYWPDFKRPYFEEAIREYQRRERRFGGVNGS